MEETSTSRVTGGVREGGGREGKGRREGEGRRGGGEEGRGVGEAGRDGSGASPFATVIAIGGENAGLFADVPTRSVCNRCARSSLPRDDATQS